jgi:hypothetical protein
VVGSLGAHSDSVRLLLARQEITGPINFKADALILLYTDLETSPFLDVFSGSKEWSAAQKSQWCDYAHKFTSLAGTI